MVGGIYIIMYCYCFTPFTFVSDFNICTFSIEISFSSQLGILSPNVHELKLCDQKLTTSFKSTAQENLMCDRADFHVKECSAG